MKERYNYVNKEGKLIYGDMLFDSIKFIEDGFSIVEKNDKYNYINKEGVYISKEWFEYAEDFKNGFAIVKLNGGWMYIDKEGNKQ